MRAVLDANVVLSATLMRGGHEDRLLRAWPRSDYESVTSPQILEEMGRALFYDKLLKFRWMSEEEVVSLPQAFARESVIVSGRVKVKASRDPEDDTFLAAAVEGRAEYGVTGDRDPLDLERDTDVEIRRPAEFLRILGRTR